MSDTVTDRLQLFFSLFVRIIICLIQRLVEQSWQLQGVDKIISTLSEKEYEEKKSDE